MKLLLELIPRGKFRLARCIILIVFILLAVNLVNLYINAAQKEGPRYRDLQEKRKEYAPRGAILDRRGYSLADNKLSRDVMAVRGRIEPGMICVFSEFLAEPLSMSSSSIAESLNGESFEIPIKSGLSEWEFNKFCDFRSRGWQSDPQKERLERIFDSYPELKEKYENFETFELAFHDEFGEIIPRKDYPRCYPTGPVTAQLIGYTSMVQRDFTAWKGIEREYDNILRGVDGYVIEWLDAFNRPVAGFESQEVGVVPGLDLRLTISMEIQMLAYRVLEERVKATHAAGGCIVILDSISGEILAMVSYPSFDPSNYQEVLEDAPAFPHLLPANQYRLNPMHNLALQLQLEPGSVMKPVEAGWALREKAITPDDLFIIRPDGFKLPGKTIRDSHPPERAESWNIKKIITYSSNQGMAQVALKMNRDTIIEGLKAFGFGSKALDFDEELMGDINDTRAKWQDVERANSGFGQGVSVTAIQMAAAMNVYANGGNYVKPKIALDATSFDGDVQYYKSNKRTLVIPPDVLEVMNEALEAVVVEGTGKPARCPGYRVAGKTGTAQKWDHPNKTYSNNRHYASFAGFGPLPDPRFTIFILLDEPTPKWGGSSCGPAFKTIFENLMIKEGIPPMEEPPADDGASTKKDTQSFQN